MLAKITWHRGDVITKLRESKGWTRGQMAVKIGVSPYWYGKIEQNGHCAPATCEKIAKQLGTTAHDIKEAIPLGREDLICMKHRDLLRQVDRIVHEGSAFAGILMVIMEAAVFAADRGFSATEVLKKHILAGDIEFINIEREIAKKLRRRKKRNQH